MQASRDTENPHRLNDASALGLAGITGTTRGEHLDQAKLVELVVDFRAPLLHIAAQHEREVAGLALVPGGQLRLGLDIGR